VVGGFLAWRGWGIGYWAVALALSGLILLLLTLARQAGGWEGLGYFGLVIIVFGPALIGLAIGGAIGLYARLKKGQGGAHD